MKLNIYADVFINVNVKMDNGGVH